MLLSYTFSYLHKSTNQSLNKMAFSYMEWWSFKVVKLDVCGSLVLSNPLANNEVFNLGALTVKRIAIASYSS